MADEVTINITEAVDEVTIDALDGSLPSPSDHGNLTGLLDDDHPLYHTDARALAWLGARSTTDLSEGLSLYFTTARAQAVVDADASLLKADGSRNVSGVLTLDPLPEPAWAEGQLYYDANSNTLSFQNDVPNVTLNIGEEVYVRAVNKTGVTLANGQVVYIDSAQGNRPTITLANASSASTSDGTLGVVTADIANNAEGLVTIIGVVRGLDTSAFTEGDMIYLSAATAGTFTNVKPTTPDRAVQLGVVLSSHNTQGEILVRIDSTQDLGDLQDVLITSLSTGQMVIWDATSGYWKNSTRYYLDEAGDEHHFAGGFRMDDAQWDDLRFPATTVRQGSTLKPDFDTTDVGLLFPQNDPLEIAYIIGQMPHEWKLESEIKPHIHYIQDEVTVPVFKIDYRIYKNGDAPPAFTTLTTSGTPALTYTSGSIAQIMSFPAIDMTGIDAVSAIVDVKLYRDDNVVSGDVLVKEFDFHYQKDTFGSRQAFVK